MAEYHPEEEISFTSVQRFDDCVRIVHEPAKNALSKQEGGGHYKGLAIQPVEYIEKNGLDYLQGNVIKYATRHKSKNGAEDIKKAIHYLELILDLQYGDQRA